MAIEEIAFYNTNGEEITLSNIVNQMIDYYRLKREVGETKITDFNEGSEIRNLLEAFAIGIYALLDQQHEATKIAFISTSEGIFLDRIGELPFIDLARIQSEYAVGEVTFTLATAQSDDYTIPADTILACSSSGLEFVTTSECIISAGDTTGTASAECLTTGSDGNVVAGSIDTVSSEYVDVELVSVTNATAFEAGADEEDDEVYRERLLENVRADGFGTQGWYVNLCESVDGVHDVVLVNETGYTKKALVNGYVKETPSTVLLDVLTKLTDAHNHVLNHTFTVGKPTYTSESLTIDLNVTTAVDTSDLTAVLQKVFNGGNFHEGEYDGLNINQSLTKEEIVRAFDIFDAVVSVSSVKHDVSGTATDFDELTPAPMGVLKLASVTFTQTEV